jgi:hypothetical protein
METATKESDVDLLILVDDERRFSHPSYPGLNWSIEAENHVPGQR